MATAFPHFNELPAELRSRIWEYALHDEYGALGGSDRIIEFYDYDRASSVTFALSRQYPSLFFVSRETRYEAAKLDGGEWMPVYLDCNEAKDSFTDVAFEVWINFRRDTINLSERFTNVSSTLVWHEFRISVEQYRLQWLASLLDHTTLQKIRNFRLSVSRPPVARRLENEAWWRGEGLELFAPSVLKRVTIVTNHNDLALWTRMIILDMLGEVWGVGNEHGKLPLVGLYVFSEDGPDWYRTEASWFRLE